ncbi:M2 family metallopeptidase [Myxococcota bacterium]|nr:M2 family metallopeptidase [Myxococcota bacterium]MBU1413660.1 M2 family metallopeptidase [Myxococcota bacterium]MBU1511723.1 M2 family metallopeptidase [Myxococcota bacterium]
MKLNQVISVLLGVSLFSCTPKTTPQTSQKGPDKAVPVEKSMKEQAGEFLKSYQTELATLEAAYAQAFWKASNSGQDADFAEAGKTELALRAYHSSPEMFKKINGFLAKKAELDPLAVRQLEVAYLAFAENQLTQEQLKILVDKGKEIEKINNNFRGKVGDKEYTNNALLQMLAKEKDSRKRQAAWEALKQVGAQTGPKLVELAKIRNEAARKLGYANYWDMRIRLQEHDPAMIMEIFDGLEKLTAEPFKKMKAKMDAQIAKKLKVKVADLMPWHYDNPFFQEAPPSDEIDLDVFFKGKKEQDIVDIGRKFFADIDLPMDDLAAKSDFFERAGKDQHAFCITMNRAEDVRMLLNVKPTAQWMDTMMHETGHAVYYKWIDRTLPYNLRESSHIFTTEGIAMMFGALAKNPLWLTEIVKADPKLVLKVKAAILDQRKLEQLIFARWAMVMLNFEKALYENPDQDLNKLWWDLVERLQMIKRPAGRNLPDWASKPHFTIAPVYYHNYALGELFAAQLRAAIAKNLKHTGPVSDMSWNQKAIGQWLIQEVFAPGMKTPWPQFVEKVTGAKLSADAFAAEVSN